MDLWALFISAFLASTLLPGGSEIALGVIAQNNNNSNLLLIAIATLGNTLGGITSWWIGYYLPKLKSNQQQAIDRIRRFGSPILLLSWLPLIGDPLCVAAGWLRLSFWKSVFFIASGKMLRYVVVIYFFA